MFLILCLKLLIRSLKNLITSHRNQRSEALAFASVSLRWCGLAACLVCFLAVIALACLLSPSGVSFVVCLTYVCAACLVFWPSLCLLACFLAFPSGVSFIDRVALCSSSDHFRLPVLSLLLLLLLLLSAPLPNPPITLLSRATGSLGRRTCRGTSQTR